MRRVLHAFLAALLAPLLAALLALAPLAAGPARADEALLLNTGVAAPYTAPDHTGFLDRVTAELFRRIGRAARVQVYTATERGIINADKGVEDGLVLRIRGLERNYPNLVMVPEVLIGNDFVACATDPGIKVERWDDLRPLVVSHIIGWKVFEANVPPTAELTLTADADQLFHMLATRRADVVLYERWQALWRIRERGLNARVLEPPLARADMFIYLNKRHEALAAPLARELAAMKADGSYQRIHDETLGALMY